LTRLDITDDRPAHLSMHDVAPETLDHVRVFLERLKEVGTGPCMLLVIPGKTWSPADVDQLRRWQGEGHLLAGHGWLHRISRYGGWFHRLHSLSLSRNVAEHLSLNAAGIQELILRCAEWFPAHGFEIPDHYVPPAWAMGAVSKEQLQQLPFRTYEYFHGVYDSERNQVVRCPLMGFEADTWLRATCCRMFNSFNMTFKPGAGPLRISLHPHDLQLRLRNDLITVCQRVSCTPVLTLG